MPASLRRRLHATLLIPLHVSCHDCLVLFRHENIRIIVFTHTSAQILLLTPDDTLDHLFPNPSQPSPSSPPSFPSNLSSTVTACLTPDAKLPPTARAPRLVQRNWCSLSPRESHPSSAWSAYSAIHRPHRAARHIPSACATSQTALVSRERLQTASHEP